MTWHLDKGRPLCPQIGEQLCLQIALGHFKPHQRLFSVREAAMAAGVNPNTVQHAFEQLEQEGILYSVRGSGWYVAEDVSRARQTLERLWAEKTAAYFETMGALGLDAEAIKTYVKEWEHE
ncbi:MAG: GntR family transcriptional regulator [Clostridia bacterium]|nr:GntR family transcriptional regulator [Clostridia bacterium]